MTNLPYSQWAILADWVKANAAMLMTGLMDADTAMLAHVAMPDGRRVIDAMRDAEHPLLPKPKGGE